MKRYIVKLICTALATVSLVSCADFLQEESLYYIPLEETLRNEEEAIQFLYGGYSLMQSLMFGSEFTSVTDMMTDDLDFASTDITRRGLNSLTYSNNNKNIKSIWGKFYAVIQQMNVLLDHMENNTKLQEINSRNALTCEARFIRGWCYFHLVQLWGEVPLMTIPVYDIKKDNVFPARESLDNVYSLIISDFAYAAATMSDDFRRITVKSGITYTLALRRAAAKLMLGKTYIVLHQYEDALDALSYFGTPGSINARFSLVEPFNYLFETPYKKLPVRKNEVLWELEAAAESGYNNTLHREVAPAAVDDDKIVDPFGGAINGKTNGYQYYIPTYDLIKSFDVNDIRYQQTYVFSKPPPSSRPHIRKGYDAEATDQNTAGAHILLLRVADAYLLLAEAYNELHAPGTAAEFVNLVRKRAGLVDLPSDMTEAAMRDAILLERRHEFAHEGAYRIIDLRRTGRYKDVMVAYNKQQTLLVLGQDESGTEIPTTEKFIVYDNHGQKLRETSAINIPFVTANKFWNDKLWLHAIPNDERIANPQIKVKNDWN